MTCREATNLLPLFFDGELDARQMRAVALHSARCESCERDLRHLEHVQELISDTIDSAADDIDLENLWPAVERRLSSTREPWWSRLRAWWSDGEHVWITRLPAFAAAAVIAALVFLLFAHTPPLSTPPAAPQLAAVDNATSIESLVTDVDSVAVLNDPETRTTVLWVNDPGPGDAP
jgi:anti-sigma factor RsiW